jgi:hypothetical protein
MRSKKRKRLVYVFFILIYFFCFRIFAQDNGIITGILIDRETQKPIIEADVKILDIDKHVLTGDDGKFEFRNIPLGTYRLQASCTGYETVVKTDIVLLSARPTNVIIELISKSYKTDTIDVRAQYFQKSSTENTSSYNLDFEEVRRAPGAVEDISRMVQIMPGVSPANDQRNDLIVRGGSPAENMTIIDGIDVPNINHYPTQASTGGPIGMINVKFIDDVNFMTGGFSSRYGDKLSSVLDIRFREGYRKKILSDINLSTAGFGGVFEGPLFSEKGSFLLSVRKSYLNLIKGAIRFSTVPNYWDFNVKTVYDINRNNKLTFLGIGGLDNISFTGSDAQVSDENPYGKAQGNQQEFTTGFNLKTLFKKGYLQTVLSNSTSFYKYDDHDINTDALKFDYNSYESDFNLKSELYYQINKSNNLIIGAGVDYIKFKNDLFVIADTSAFGDPIPEQDIYIKTNFNKANAFAQYTLKLFNDKLTANAGLRFDHFSGINDNITFNPRFGISYQLTSVTSLNFSTGIFSQSPEYLWVTSDPRNKDLKYLKTYHYVAGVEHLFTEDIKFSVELYYKKYTDYPVSVLMPTFVLVNGGTEYGPNFVGEATSAGYGFARGIDFSLQKKLTGNGIYGMLNYSLSDCRFTALAGGEKPGSFDYRHNLTVIAGYQISNNWLIGIKYRYTTGRPYTPYDVQLSTIYGRGIYAADQFNDARYKDYNRLDIRVDKKWNYKNWSIVAYVELQNVFNTTNVYQYFWNEYRNEQGTIYQWAFLPVGGFSVQF